MKSGCRPPNALQHALGQHALGGASFHLLLQISHGDDAFCECSEKRARSQRISRNPGCASQQDPSLALLASGRSATSRQRRRSAQKPSRNISRWTHVLGRDPADRERYADG
jgi:hypothetical protein